MKRVEEVLKDHIYPMTRRTNWVYERTVYDGRRMEGHPVATGTVASNPLEVPRSGSHFNLTCSADVFTY